VLALLVDRTAARRASRVARLRDRDRFRASGRPRSGRQRYRDLVASIEHLDELRRRLAEQTDQGSAADRVTTGRLARMRRRLSELEHISENTIDEAEAMSAEEEVLEIMDSLENVRELRPSDGGRA
jgi:hypothetical protein